MSKRKSRRRNRYEMVDENAVNNVVAMQEYESMAKRFPKAVEVKPRNVKQAEYLKEHYEDSDLWWIEDKPENALAGYNAGMKPILIEHGHNMDYKGPAKVCKTWKDVYELIVASV